MGSIETKLKKLEDDSPFERFELKDGSFYWYKPDELWRAFFAYYFSALQTDFEGAPREEVPDVFKAIARAKDREAAMTQVAPTWREWRTDFDLKACIDFNELVETGKISPLTGSATSTRLILVSLKRTERSTNSSSPRRRRRGGTSGSDCYREHDGVQCCFDG